MEVSGEGGDGADAEDFSIGGALVLEDVEEFFAGAEDGFGVFEGDAAGFGEDEGFVLAVEEVEAEAFLEAAELGAEGRLGNFEVFGGAGEATFVGDGAEVAEVVVVEEGHFFEW